MLQLGVAVIEDERCCVFTHTVGKPRLLLNAYLKTTQDAIRACTGDDLMRRFDSAGSSGAPVLTRGQMYQNPEIVATKALVEYACDLAIRLRQTTPAAQFSCTAATVRNSIRNRYANLFGRIWYQAIATFSSLRFVANEHAPGCLNLHPCHEYQARWNLPNAHGGIS